MHFRTRIIQRTGAAACLLALCLCACEKTERKPLETSPRPSESTIEQRAAERRMALFDRYDRWLRARVAAFPPLGLTPGDLGGGLAAARGPVLAALGIEAAAPNIAVSKSWAKRLGGARIEGWRIASPDGSVEIPALLWLPPDTRPRSVVVLANGTGQNKHDFVSQFSCGSYVRAGAACISWDSAGEGERSHNPLTRGREFLNDDAIAMSADIGQPLLGVHVREIRALVSAAKSDERLAALPLALAGYSLGGWTGLLTGLVDERIDFLVAASTMVIPPEVSGLHAGGWRVPGLARAIKLRELLALNAHAHPTLWINGEADPSFVTDDARRSQILNETAAGAHALLGVKSKRLVHRVVPRGAHLPYHFAPPALQFLADAGVLPSLNESGLPAQPLEPLTGRLAEVVTTTELKVWPRSMMEAAYAPKGVPLLPAKELLVGGKFPMLDEWLAAQVDAAQAKAMLPSDRAERARHVKRLLDPAFDSLVDAGRWKQAGENAWEDSMLGLRARRESGGGEGLAVYFPKNRTILGETVPADLQGRAAVIVLMEPLSYSDNEVAANTTATGHTLAALLSLLAGPVRGAAAGYEVVDGTGTLAVPLAMLDDRVSAMTLTARQLTTIAPTQFQFEGHVPGFTTVMPWERLLGSLAPMPLRIVEKTLLEHEREALVERYAANPGALTFLP